MRILFILLFTLITTFVYPQSGGSGVRVTNRGQHPLRHKANEVDITDAGAYFTGTEGETALQEIGLFLAGISVPGADTQIIWNNAGSFGAENNFLWDDSTKTLWLYDSTDVDYIYLRHDGSGAMFGVTGGDLEFILSNDLRLGVADSDKTYIGGAKDAYFEFDSDSWNFTANAVTASDDFEFTGDSFKFFCNDVNVFGGASFYAWDSTNADNVQIVHDGTDGAINTNAGDLILNPTGDVTTAGTLEAGTLTEGGNAVYNSTETPGGELGGTWGSPTIDDLFIKLGGDVATAGTYDFGSANVVLEIPNAAAPTTDTTGEIAIDTDLITQGMLQVYLASAIANVVATTDTPGDNEVPTYDLAGGTIQWEAAAGGGGTAIADADGDTGIDADESAGDSDIIKFEIGGVYDKYNIGCPFTDTGINALIDSLGAEGGLGILPEGTYTLSASSTIDQNYTSLEGGFWGTFLDAGAYAANTMVIDLNGADYLRIANLRMAGNAGGGFTSNLIADNNLISTNCILENLHLSNSDLHGIYFDNPDSGSNLIKNCCVVDCDLVGIQSQGNSERIVDNIVFSNSSHGIQASGLNQIVVRNYAVNNSGSGIRSSGTNQNVSNNRVVNNTSYGITSGASSVYTGNYLTENGHGFYISGISACQFIGNSVKSNDNGTYGFYIRAGSLANLFTGNFVSGGVNRQEWGFRLENGDTNSIIGNLIASHDTGGIYLDASSSDNFISGNDMFLETVATITNAGVDTHIIGNHFPVAGNLVTDTGTGTVFDNWDESAKGFWFYNEEGGVSRVLMSIGKRSLSPADNDFFDFNFDMEDDNNQDEIMVRHRTTMLDASTGTEDGQYAIGVMTGGSVIDALTMTGGASVLTLGAGTAGVDYILKFDGETNDGLITWMEDEDTFDMSCSLTLNAGQAINEFSIDGTLAGNSDTALPTEQAVKTYVDAAAGGGETLAQTLALGADANDVDTTSWGKMEGFDAGLYLDWDADGVIDFTSDGTLELHSADWDIGATGIATGMGNITSDGTIEGATLTEGGNAVYSSGETPGGELGGTFASFTIDDSVTVTGWTMGASVATTPAGDDNDTSLATTAWCETTQDYLKTSELAPTIWYGDGSDGALSIADGSTTTLTEDVYYTSITLTNNSNIDPNGFRVYVTGTTSVAAGSSIFDDGGAGVNGGAGGSGGGTQGAAGAAGTGANGGTGVYYRPAASSAGGGGGDLMAAGSNGTSGAIVQNSIYDTQATSAGAAGGAGGGIGAGAGGTAGGAGTTVQIAAADGGINRNFATLQRGRFDQIADNSIQEWTGNSGSAGGGGGGGAGIEMGAPGTGGGAGGAGGSGGIVFLASRIISNSGTISANGGAGGDGGAGGNGGGGAVNGGGGGAGGDGGSGGQVILCYNTLTGNAATATGGAAGAFGAGGTTNGNNGTVGNVGTAGTVFLFEGK